MEGDLVLSVIVVALTRTVVIFLLFEIADFLGRFAIALVGPSSFGTGISHFLFKLIEVAGLYACMMNKRKNQNDES